MLIGRDARAALSWICANNVAKPPGPLIYTQMLDDSRRNRVRPDGRAAVAGDEFYIVTGTGFATHDFDWISALNSRWAGRPTDRRHLGISPCCR